MSGKLQIVLIISAILFLLLTIKFISKKGLDLYHSIQWFAGSAILLVMAVFPGIVDYLAHLLGIEVTSNFVFLILVAYLLFAMLSLSASVSRQHDRIRRLVQTQALLEKEVGDLKHQLCTVLKNVRSLENTGHIGTGRFGENQIDEKSPSDR